MNSKCRERLLKTANSFADLVDELRVTAEVDCDNTSHELNLYVDTHYGDEIFEIIGEGLPPFPIIQRNLLILIAKNYVEHPIDGKNETPFTTDKQTTVDLPQFYASASREIITKVLDGLVSKIRKERNSLVSA